jgi:hypothetical protein
LARACIVSKQEIENLPDNLRIARHSGNLHDVKNGHVSGMPALSKKEPPHRLGFEY